MNKNLSNLTLLLCVSFLGLNAQNLVPNPSFDVQTSCPLVSEIDKATPWNSASNATPDLFNTTCPTQNTSGNSGIGSAGIYIKNSLTNYREYLHVELNETLIANKTYCVSFYLKATPFKFTTEDVGLTFFNSEPFYNQSTFVDITPDVVNQSGAIPNSWTKVEGEYLASGGENWIMIGNFDNDSDINIETLNSSSTSESVYFNIDDVSIIECASTDTTPVDTSSNVSIDYMKNGDVNVYPIPSKNVLNIDSKNSDIKSLALYNVLGQKVFLRDNIVKSKSTIDIRNIESGNYILIIEFESGSTGHVKVIKE